MSEQLKKQIEEMITYIDGENPTTDKLFYLWGIFCKEIGFKPLTSQHCYISMLFMDGKVQGFDRGTGKTFLCVYLIAFNEKYKLWKIKYASDTKILANRTKRFVKKIVKSKIIECEFVSVKEKKHVESTMNIIDTYTFSIEIINKK